VLEFGYVKQDKDRLLTTYHPLEQMDGEPLLMRKKHWLVFLEMIRGY